MADRARSESRLPYRRRRSHTGPWPLARRRRRSQPTLGSPREPREWRLPSPGVSSGLRPYADPAQSVHGKAVRNRTSLTGAARAIGILRHAGGTRCVTIRCEARLRRHQGFVRSRSLLDVGLYEELAPDLEKARHLPDELLANHEALLVTFLPPRIGEVNEHAHDRALGLEPLKRETCVFCEHARASPQTTGPEPGVDHASPLPAHFETQESEASFGLGAF